MLSENAFKEMPTLADKSSDFGFSSGIQVYFWTQRTGTTGVPPVGRGRPTGTTGILPVGEKEFFPSISTGGTPVVPVVGT